MAKSSNVDKRAVVVPSDRVAAMADARMPTRVDTVEAKGQEWKLTRAKDLPGMQGRKIRNQEQLKAYVSRIPPAPSQSR